MPQQNKTITQFPQLPVVTGSELFVVAYDPSPNYKVSMNQIAAYVGTGSGSLINPMNATGDMIFGGSIVGTSAVPSRLGIGLTGQVLKVVAGLPSWQTLATVAATGAYADLTGLPSLGTLAALSFPGGTTNFLRADGTWNVATVTFANVSGAVSTNANLQAALDLKLDRSPATQSVSSAATVTPTFLNDRVVITAQAVGLTLANPTGTPIDGLMLTIRIKDNGVARTIAYGAQYRANSSTPLPAITVAGKTLYLRCVWNSADTTLDVISVAQQP